MNDLLQWKRRVEAGHNSGSGHRCGIKLFEYFWDCMKNEKGPWRLTGHLPGIKSDLGNFQTEDDAKKLALEAFEHFCKRLNLTINP